MENTVLCVVMYTTRMCSQPGQGSSLYTSFSTRSPQSASIPCHEPFVLCPKAIVAVVVVAVVVVVVVCVYAFFFFFFFGCCFYSFPVLYAVWLMGCLTKLLTSMSLLVTWH
eukprot:m.305479 g.305479  ORF g.305479 m.305479 type:complete len:111 (+) comp15907_c0_seq12:2503-2835(+)